MAQHVMTREEALWLAVHSYGTMACCKICKTVRDFRNYKDARPQGEQSDAAFALWLLDEGWQFSWKDFQTGGWAFEVRCTACACRPPVQ